jgi:hypothetical protein
MGAKSIMNGGASFDSQLAFFGCQVRFASCEEWLDSGSKVGVRINVREGDGDGDSTPTDKESEDDDGNSWWLRLEKQRPSDVACPAFLRVGPLDQPGHSKKKKHIRHDIFPGT